MAANNLLASDVMNGSASLLNDSARTVYTYSAQLPYLKLALQELREHFELNNIPVTENVSAVINMPAGSTEINYNAVGQPALPDDFVEPLELWERAEGVDPYTPMRRRDFLPHSQEGVEINQFLIYVWQDQKIKVLPANRDNDIKIDYIKELFQDIEDQDSIINVVNAISFLEYRTAGLCAEFIERNLTSANGLNIYAIAGIERATGIGVKGKQSIQTRRRPFRASYKRRTSFT